MIASDALDPRPEFAYQLERYAREYIIDNNNCYGLAKIWIGPVPIVFCGAQESIRPILESSTNISKPSQYDIISKWIGTGLLTSTNEKWLRRRKMLTSAFHFNVLQGYHEIFVQQGEILVNLLAREKGFPWLWLKPIWYLSGFGFEFNRLVKLTNGFTRKVIAERKCVVVEREWELCEDNEGNTNKKKLAFLDLLLYMQRSHELTDEDIREEVDTFMFEGTFSRTGIISSII
uniref:Cytochrome P450 n=1 Tax=Angiostrongylus cantonensis TaxID=6313 RepID=A0A158PCS0_ANGCA